MADLRERPARLDPDVYVDASASRGLRETDVAELPEQHARLRGDAHGVGEVRPRLWVQVDAQLVGVFQVAAAYGPRVEGETAEIGRPDDGGRLGGADFVGVPAAGEADAPGRDVVVVLCHPVQSNRGKPGR